MKSNIKKIDSLILKFAVISDQKLKDLSSQPSFSAKIRFADANFKKIKAGSSRIAYEYSADLVLKLAKNEKGEAQNGVESDNFLQQNYKDLVANVIDSDPDNKWLIVERAKKVASSKFKNVTGFDLQSLGAYLYNNDPTKPTPKIKQVIQNEQLLHDSELVQELLDLIGNFAMSAADFSRASSWGEVRGRVVLIDYGLTQDIYDEYYK